MDEKGRRKTKTEGLKQDQEKRLRRWVMCCLHRDLITIESHQSKTEGERNTQNRREEKEKGKETRGAR